MRGFLFILIFLLSFFCVSKLKAQNPIWTDGTAFTIQKKKLEVSLFRPWKYGLTKKDELSSHILGSILLPHLFYKRRWVQFKLFEQRFLFSTRHGLYYPRFALNLNKRLNFKYIELVPNDLSIPHTLAFQNEIILSHFLNEPTHCRAGDKLLTARLGFKYALKFSQYEHPLIYRSLLYRETIVLYPGFVWYVGADIDGHLNRFFNYFADIDYYAHEFIKSWSVESKLGITGYSGKHLTGIAGIKLGYSKIIGGNQFLIMPIAGFSYLFDLRKKEKFKNRLFKNDVFKHDNSLERDDKYYEMEEKRESLKDTIN